jgi:hypothetical protein
VRRARVIASLVACAWLIGAAQPAAVCAQDPERQAAESFERGTAAYQRGDYRDAAEQFEQALRLAPRAATAYSAALAWEAAGERGRAADALETALAQPGLSASEAGDAQARLAALNRLLGVVAVTAPIGGAVDAAHASGIPIPARIHAAPGPLVVTVVAAGGARSTRTVDVVAGRTVTVADTPAPPHVKSAPPAASSARQPRSAPPGRPVRVEDGAEEQPPATGTVIGAVLIGAGAIGGGVAIVLGLKAVSTRDEFAAGGYTDAGLHDDAVALRTATNVAWAGAGALVAGGTVLLIASLAGSRSPPSSARSAPPSLVWRF